MNLPRLTAAFASFALFAACSADPPAEAPPQADPADAPAADEARITEESARANAFFEAVFEEELSHSPQFQAQLGIRDDYDQWDDLSESSADAAYQRAQRQLAEAEDTIDFELLDEQTALSYELFRHEAQRRIDTYQWRHHSYMLTQMRGMHAGVPTFLINIHRIQDESDAEAYIARLERVEPLFEQVHEQLDIRDEKGILPPRFTFARVLDGAGNVIDGYPFNDNGESPLYEDFRNKVEALSLPEARQNELLEQARAALLEHVGPAYEKLMDRVAAREEDATEDAGIWKLPDGSDYYAFELERMTTTELSAQEIHDIGLREVARIHDEMREIMNVVEYDGTLEEFFEFMRTDEQFYYPDTDEGRQAYLDGATDLINAFRDRLDEAFTVTPRAEMEVRAVEPFRERTAGKAFYQRASPDGSRPGIYYANLYRMEDMPIYQKEALAYHEGIPGHHMQIAIAQELEGIPTFRRHIHYQAYTEGWALYSEYFPKEMGFYEDPYSDFGRLAMELWRAARLVVDTGLHELQWTREEAIDYLVENTPNPPGDAQNAIERYIVIPGQATVYLIGMLRILDIRETAREALGDDFDIREFHDAVLENGAMPLDMLEEVVLERLGVR